MPLRDFDAQRLFVDAPLAPGEQVDCGRDQANYLVNVLRLKTGDEILIFNGRDGEWRARIEAGKKSCRLIAAEQTRAQEAGPDIHYLFAPLKRSRLDYMVQKATEMGVARLVPVITRRTIAERVNLDRMRANAVEAAEQCGILRIPEVDEPRRLDQALAGWDASRRLIFCDEDADIASPIEALHSLSGGTSADQLPPIAVLIGPEGGFDPAEREMLIAKPYTLRISLGPRVMRADTAAIAALALVNAAVGDWR